MVDNLIAFLGQCWNKGENTNLATVQGEEILPLVGRAEDEMKDDVKACGSGEGPREDYYLTD